MKGFNASPRLLLLAALALPGVAPAQEAAPADEQHSPSGIADVEQQADDGIVEVRTLAGTLRMPFAVPQTRHEIRREVTRFERSGFVAREDVLLGPPGDQSMTLSIMLVSPDGATDSSLAEHFAAGASGMLGAPGVDEVRAVELAGFPFHLIRSGFELPATSRDGDQAGEAGAPRVFRRLVLAGTVQRMALSLTLVFPQAMAADEASLVEALLAFDFDFASQLRQRRIFDEEVARTLGGEHIVTQIGVLPRSPEMSAYLDWTMEVRKGDGSAVSRTQRFKILHSTFFRTDLVTVDLQCDFEGAGTPEERARRIHREARFDGEGPTSSRIGAIPGMQWRGELPPDGDYRFSTRVADRDGVRTVATFSYDGSRRLVEQLDAWLDDADLPGCAPDAWVDGVPSGG